MGKAWPALDIHLPGCDPQLLELVLAEVDDFQPSAIQESDDSSRLRVFFATPQSRQDAAGALAAAFGSHLFAEPLDVADEDWAARSQAELRAIRIGRLMIAPPWDVPDTKAIVIRPSMGFGTGHHATTRLMLKAIQMLPVEGKTVLDLGCGSGVLAIAAVRLGARSAVGVDVDPDALENARENAGLNDAGDRVRFEEGDFREMSARANVVMANLTGGLLERSAEALAAMVAPNGHMVVGGFTETEIATVVAALEKFLTLQEMIQEEEWMCAILVRGSVGV